MTAEPQPSQVAQRADAAHVPQGPAYRIADAALLADRLAVQDLWSAHLMGHNTLAAAAKFRLGYLDNPAGEAGAVLLYASDDATPKGVLGLHPRVFHQGARALRAVGLADYVVDPRHRALGPALKLMRRAIERASDSADVVYGLPNKKAAPVLGRAGLRRLGEVHRYAKLLRSGGKLSERLPVLVAPVCAVAVDMGLRLSDLKRRLTLPARLVCEPAAWADSDWDTAVDELWDRRPGGLLLSERSAAMLRWRHGAPDRAGWLLCLARDGQGTLQGYIVWRLRGTLVEVGDFFTAEPGRWTAPLMLAFAPLARRAGAASVSVNFFGSPIVENALHACGMTARPHDGQLFKQPGEAEGQRFDDPALWYLTDFDNDGD